jgi:hypothetical protein
VQILERYFDALRAHDWPALASCLSVDVHRSGPYLDDVRGRQPYIDFLSRVLPSLSNHELEVSRIREIGPRSAIVELSETVDVKGERREFPEALLFDLDAQGLISRIDIYIKQPLGRMARRSTSKR